MVEEQEFRPSSNKRHWYGPGCYMYEDGVYRGWESAREYMMTIMGEPECAVLEMDFNVEHCLNLARRVNFSFLKNVLFPALVEQLEDKAREKLADIKLQDVIRVWLELDPEIDAVRGASYEGEEFCGTPAGGKYYPPNILLDVQVIVCVRLQSGITNIRVFREFAV